MPKIVFLLVFLINSLNALTQNTLITGKFPGAQGKTLQITKYSDQITYADTCLATVLVDSSGLFTVAVPVSETVLANIKIDFFKSPIYVESGKTYSLVIDSIDFNAADDKINPYFNPKTFNYTIINSDSLELNTLISGFNRQYDTFLEKYFVRLTKSRDRKLLDSFCLKVNKSYRFIQNEYFNNLVRYRLASLEYFARSVNISKLIEKYILNQPVLLENTGYMEFFNQLFEGYVVAQSKQIKPRDIDKTVNDLISCAALLDSLGKDTMLRNERIREIVMLKTIGELYTNPLFKKNAVIQILKDFVEMTHFKEHRMIAKSYIGLYTRLEKGSKAPYFELSGFNGETYSLDEFKGRYVYLVFWTTWCIPCNSEMDILYKMHKKYGSQIAIVSIACDKQKLKAYYLLENKKPEFTALFWDNSFRLLKDYNVKAYPSYFLINPQGNIAENPAIKPGPALDSYFSVLTGIKSK